MEIWKRGNILPNPVYFFHVRCPEQSLHMGNRQVIYFNVVWAQRNFFRGPLPELSVMLRLYLTSWSTHVGLGTGVLFLLTNVSYERVESVNRGITVKPLTVRLLVKFQAQSPRITDCEWIRNSSLKFRLRLNYWTDSQSVDCVEKPDSSPKFWERNHHRANLRRDSPPWLCRYYMLRWRFFIRIEYPPYPNRILHLAIQSKYENFAIFRIQIIEPPTRQRSETQPFECWVYKY